MDKKFQCLIYSLITLASLIVTFIYIKTMYAPVSPEIYDIKEEFITSSSVCDANQEIEYMTYKDTEIWWEPNNKFGLYVYAEERDFFEIAQNLVNSNGGEWGYVLIPYNMSDRDYAKWSRVFDQLRNKQLIPVIQLWDVDRDNYKEQTRGAAEFLNRFLWPIKYKYVSVYNEPNDAKFWYNTIDPEQYAEILNFTIDAFKETNEDFVLMNGAFNVSAPSNENNMDSFTYMKRMNTAYPGIFEKLDAWASHSYPQPNFSGNPLSSGRWSIRAYEEELEYLKDSLGVKKDLPVFITETGWAHAEGENYNSSYYSVDKIGEFFETAFEEVWLKDDRVRAVMPFTIRYDAPFDHFSWVSKDNVAYKHYHVVEDLDKVSGEPPVLETAKVIINLCTQ